jgi:hypothetical protein
MPSSEDHETCPEPVEWVPILDEIRARPDPEDPSSIVHLPSSPPRHPNWRGRRPGAGAPKGNLNALKHGRTSRQQARIVEALMQVPGARETMIALANRNRRLRKQAEEGVGVFVTRLLERAAEMVLNQENVPDQNNQEFLDFLNTATAQMRVLLEKQTRLRRKPIKPVLSRPQGRVEGRPE